MAEPFDAEIRIKGARQAARELEKVERATDDLGRTSEGSTSSLSNFAAGIGGATIAVQAAAGAIRSALGALQDFAAEFERQAGIINRFNGDISEASRRMNGLVSDIELMEAQAVLLNAGLDVSAEQFADLSVAANEMAAATGREGGAKAITQLASAVARAQSGKLKEFGIDLSEVTDVADKQELALEKLSEQYGDVESSADTLGGKLGTLSTALDNAETKFFEALNASNQMSESVDRLGEAIQSAFGGNATEAIDDLIESLAHGLGAAIATVSDQMTLLVRAFDELGQNNFAQAAGLFANAVTGGGAGFAANFEARVREGMRADVQREVDRIASEGRSGDAAGGGAGGGGAGGGARAANDGDPFAGGTMAGLGRDVLGGLGEQQTFMGGLGGVTGPSASGMAGLSTDDADSMRDASEQIAENLRDVRAELDEIARAAEAANARFEQMGGRAMGVLVDGIQLAKQENETLLSGLASALETFLKQKAIEEAIDGASALAVAIGNSVSNPALSATKFQEAAMHFAIAAAAGGGGALAGSVAGAAQGGGGAGAGEARPTSADAGGGTGGGGGGGGTTVININAPVSEQEQGRMLRRTERAAQRRFAAA